MRALVRLGLTVAAVAAPAVLVVPAEAAKPKPKPKPIVGSYTASANPDPTSTNPVTNDPCEPTLPGSMDHHPFVVPAAGTLTVSLANKLDWSLALRTADGETLAVSEGGTPMDKESITYIFKGKRAVAFDACNFLGEPSVGVSYTFTYRG